MTRPAGMRRSGRRCVAVLAVGVLALSACDTGGTDPGSDAPTGATSAGPTATATPSPPDDESPSTDDASASTEAATTTAAPETVLDEHGVSAGHPLAVEAGMEILEAGGNAVDAAVAAAFAVSVVEPFASGIGGGGATIVAAPDSEPRAYDYREEVPRDGVVPASGAGVPGFVAGMGTLHEEHGSLPWERVLRPAQELAEEGFEVTPFLAVRMRSDGGPAAVTGLPHFSPGGAPLQAGEVLVQSDLADTIGTLREEGPDDFYTGSLADSLTSTSAEIDPESLGAYEVLSGDPVRGDLGAYSLLASRPALPGAAMIQMLQTLESGGIEDVDPDSADYVRQVSDAWLQAEETVRTRLGDPRFVDVPVDDIVAAPPRTATPVAAAAPAPQEPSEPGSPANTTHVTVVDEDGTTVSMTNTIMFFWGSGQMVDGYFLNNHLSRFEAIASPLNQPGPGRRPVTWTNPMIVLDEQDRPVLGIGSPGGEQILNIMGTVLTRWALLDQPLDDAVSAPRFRYDEDVQTLFTEDAMPAGVRQDLAADGWQVELWTRERAGFGSVQALEIDYGAGTLRGAVDTRREADNDIRSSG
ncbi:gamma-glutamyltransferase [Serinicoccus kebangsaanensis]|uniref:gamma-glutamyltransferase n=1 Tax=Serinicoccus kebangsaanensis TaxID=2602069 RepID=UPI00124E65C9|nr:gamma-glutamyltransferase [Serinicoccus kebangsaanensis]